MTFPHARSHHARMVTRAQRAAAATVSKVADTLALAQQIREQADAAPADTKNLALPSHEQIASAIECAASHLLGFTPRAVNLIDKALSDANTVDLLNPTVNVPAYGPDGVTPLLNPDGTPMLIPIPDERARLTNVKVRQQGLDVARDVLLTAGILPAHTSSRIVANFFLGADAPGFAPILRQLLGLNETVPMPDGDGRVSVDADFEDVTDSPVE